MVALLIKECLFLTQLNIKHLANKLGAFFMRNFKEVIIMSKKDDKKNSQSEEPENVYGEIKETDPTVLNDEYEFGGGGDEDDDTD